jgi:hypothetical protein
MCSSKKAAAPAQPTPTPAVVPTDRPAGQQAAVQSAVAADQQMKAEASKSTEQRLGDASSPILPG